MRKLAWFIMAVFSTILAVAVACAVNDPFKQAVSSTLNGVGGGILVGLGGAMQGLALIVSENVTNFTIYTCAILITGGVLWIGVKKLWARRPEILQKKVTLQSYQGQPNYQPPQQIAAQPVPVVQPKPEEKKLEAVAA
jgi:predicted lipid-binding transport protein (Tim44 family)